MGDEKRKRKKKRKKNKMIVVDENKPQEINNNDEDKKLEAIKTNEENNLYKPICRNGVCSYMYSTVGKCHTFYQDRLFVS